MMQGNKEVDMEGEACESDVQLTQIITYNLTDILRSQYPLLVLILIPLLILILILLRRDVEKSKREDKELEKEKSPLK